MKGDENNPLQTPKEDLISDEKNAPMNPQSQETKGDNSAAPSENNSQTGLKVLQYIAYPFLAFLVTLIGNLVIGSVMMGIGFGIVFAIVGVCLYLGLCFVCCCCFASEATSSNHADNKVVIHNNTYVTNEQKNQINQNVYNGNNNNNNNNNAAQDNQKLINAEPIDIQNQNRANAPGANCPPEHKFQTLSVKENNNEKNSENENKAKKASLNLNKNIAADI